MEPPSLRWQGTFEVLPQTATAQGQLQGDKIILPQAALEQLLSASSTSSQSSPFYPAQTEQSSLPSPLTFRLRNGLTGKEAYAGILEFSAPEGTIAISPWLASALGLDDAKEISEPAQISVNYQHLSKGTYVRLRPTEAGYNPDDWKALLERQLRDGYTTLTKGLTLPVRGVRGELFSFLVDKLEPDEPAVCVVDTDVEVDIEAMDEEQARETLRQVAARAAASSVQGSSPGGELDVWKPTEGYVTPGQYVDYSLPSWSRSQALSISVTLLDDASDDALDLFISPKSSKQRQHPRESAHVFGSLASAVDGMKEIILSPSNIELEGAESLMISVHGYTNAEESSTSSTLSAKAVRYSIRIQARSGEKVHPTNGAAPSSADEEVHSPEDEQCSNCMQWVPKRTMMLHQNFCLRNNTRCKDCSAVFKKGSPEMEAHWHCPLDTASGNSSLSKEKHDSLFHTEHTCPSCPFTTNSMSDLARHRTSICPGKLILCRFCHLEVPQEGDPFNPSPEVVFSGMTAHELADGARTTDCHLCHKIVRLRDMETHMKHHELDKTRRSAPPICHNVNCGRTLHGVGAKGQVRSVAATPGEGARTQLGLCATCFGPLYVSMHDPEGKALRRRVERRYLGQLMTGCGKSHCNNEWCRTGRSNTDLPAKATSAREALPLVKPLLESLTTDPKDAPLYFCVEEASHRQRGMAELVAAEGVWELAWTVAAAEAENGELGRMRDWLQAWAPTRYTN